jgi:hypothetical protein
MLFQVLISGCLRLERTTPPNTNLVLHIHEYWNYLVQCLPKRGLMC